MVSAAEKLTGTPRHPEKAQVGGCCLSHRCRMMNLNVFLALSLILAAAFVIIWRRSFDQYERSLTQSLKQLWTAFLRMSGIRHGMPDYVKLSSVPLPAPLPSFDISKARPRPYRPLRWPYHQTMALKKMEPDFWIELESTYVKRIAQRRRLFEEHGKRVADVLPGHEPACRELMEMAVQFLCARYPNQFTFVRKTSIFHNHVLVTEADISTVDPLVFLIDHVPEDFLFTHKDRTSGLHVMSGGVACSALGWNVSTKIGKPLQEMHGPVPDYEDKLEFSMERFFSKLTCAKPIQRGSWSLEIGQPLFLQPGDPHFELRETQAPNLRIEDIHLRVDWQTLRRLPQSRALVINFKALFTPITSFRQEPFIPRLLAKILREGKATLMQYKGTFHIQHVTLPTLELWAREQEDKGWVPRDWEERTLDEDPYFPGWEARM